MTFKGVLDAGETITFYYDDAGRAAEGTVYTRASGATGYSEWRNNADITKAVFTPSCAAIANRFSTCSPCGRRVGRAVDGGRQ